MKGRIGILGRSCGCCVCLSSWGLGAIGEGLWPDLRGDLCQLAHRPFGFRFWKGDVLLGFIRHRALMVLGWSAAPCNAQDSADNKRYGKFVVPSGRCESRLVSWRSRQKLNHMSIVRLHDFRHSATMFYDLRRNSAQRKQGQPEFEGIAGFNRVADLI